MYIGSRIKRLRETLGDMGILVLPIFCGSDPDRTNYMHVAVSPPLSRQSVAQACASRPIVPPMTRTEIVKRIGTIKDRCDNVVNFPAKLAEQTVFVPSNDPEVAIPPLGTRVAARDD